MFRLPRAIFRNKINYRNTKVDLQDPVNYSLDHIHPFQNRVLRRICGSEWDEVTGEWRRLHNEDLYAVYSSPNIIRVITSRRLRWAGHVARMEKSKGFSGET